MNTLASKSSGFPKGPAKAKRGQRQEQGFAVLVVFILMVLMFGLVVQSGLVLRGLHQELRLLEKRQIRKLQVTSAGTNAVPAAMTNRPQLTDYGQNPLH